MENQIFTQSLFNPISSVTDGEYWSLPRHLI